jgi:hypothetical protein
MFNIYIWNPFKTSFTNPPPSKSRNGPHNNIQVSNIIPQLPCLLNQIISVSTIKTILSFRSWSRIVLLVLFLLRLIPHSTRVLNDRVVGCYLLFSRLELKLPMTIFHTGFLSGHNIDLLSLKRIKNCCINKKV